MLKSPISDDARDSMTTEEKEIEETLYHEKDHFDHPTSIALRRAVIYVLQNRKAEGIGEDNMVDASEEVWFTKDGDNGTICRDYLLKDQATLIRPPQKAKYPPETQVAVPRASQKLARLQSGCTAARAEKSAAKLKTQT